MAQGRCQGRGFAGSKSTVSIALGGAQRRIERAARPRGDLRPRLLDPGDASVIRLMHEGSANEPAPNLSVGAKVT